MRKKIISALLCAAFVVAGAGVTASAGNLVSERDPDEFTLQYAYLNYIAPTLSISSRTATVKGAIEGYSHVTKISYEVTLQVKDGSSWRYVASWSGSKSASSATYSYSKSGLISGNTYRIQTVATIYSGNSSETVTAYSVERSA